MSRRPPDPRPVIIFPSAGEKHREPVCEECGGEIPNDPWKSRNTNKRFCSDRCRLRVRDRLRYAADPEAARARSRAYYAANRERVIARVIATRKQREEDLRAGG
jgi:hypothetical protein